MADQQESGPLKLACPLCKGTFTGRLPARTVKGTCPRCRKNLILFPDGKVQTEKEFNAESSPSPDPAVSEEEELTGMGKSIFSLLLFLLPVVTLLIMTSIKLPEETSNIFHNLGERAAKGLTEMQMKIQKQVNPGKEEVQIPTRRMPKRS